MRKLIIFANGKKMEVPNPTKIIIAIRDSDLHHHQASVDVNVPNIIYLKKTIRRIV
jgi:hypothetical protein